MTIGYGVTNIYSYAFANCPELTDVYCLTEKVPNSYYYNFFDDYYIEYATLHVPSELVEAYKSKIPWNSFKSIVAIEDEIKEKCATPIIAFVDGKLTYICETEDVEFVSEIICSDAKKHYGSEVPLSCTYHVCVYATKEGWKNSDVVTKDIELSVGAVGDVNGDGVIDVSDYIGVANIILTGNIRGE